MRTSNLEKTKLYAFTPWRYIRNWKWWYISTRSYLQRSNYYICVCVCVCMHRSTKFSCTSKPCSRDIEAWYTPAQLHVNWSTEEYLQFYIGGESDCGSHDISDWEWPKGYGLERLTKGHYIPHVKYALLHIHMYTYWRIVNFSESDTVIIWVL